MGESSFPPSTFAATAIAAWPYSFIAWLPLGSQSPNSLTDYLVITHDRQGCIRAQPLGTLMLQLEDAFPDAHMDRTDGLKLIWPDRWIHVRSSNTEPLLRFSAEGKTEETMDKLYKEVERLLK